MERSTKNKIKQNSNKKNTEKKTVLRKKENKNKKIILIGILSFIFGFFCFALYEIYKEVNPDYLKLGSKRSKYSIDLEKKKESFLQEYGDIYGYNGRIDEIRRAQTPQLKGANLIIL